MLFLPLVCVARHRYGGQAAGELTIVEADDYIQVHGEVGWLGYLSRTVGTIHGFGTKYIFFLNAEINRKR